MKVKVLRKFIDKNTGKARKKGDVFTCNKERFDEINRNGVDLKVGKLVEEIKEEKTEAAK